ncbi:BTAD domain-containing putative transcriptional regulator [Nonomuraea sp. NPDC050540]|uniref:AfsR/SARP family transcriptional regulator n=1 Tax=Nonomuraea sp. NPDC050540 TaxID=3364367 RepID=UPI0037AA55AA
MTTYELLQRIGARTEGEVIDIKRPQLVRLLAVLLLAKGKPVSEMRLTERIFDDARPGEVRTQNIQTLVSLLRAVLSDPLDKVAAGYLLKVNPERVDALRFEERVTRARELLGTDHTEAARLFRVALQEWGPRVEELCGPEPLPGLKGDWAEHERNTLRSQYREALLQCLEIELESGRHERLIPELVRLSNADETGRDHQELARLLMLAYARAGRVPEALSVYRRIAERKQEMGLDVDPRLTQLYRYLINEEKATDLSPKNAESAKSGPVFGDTIQNGDHGRIYQAGSMVFHEGREDR